MRNGFLFADGDLSDVLETKRKGEMKYAIDSMDGNRLLNSSVDDLCDYFVAEHSSIVPVLHEDQISLGQQETRFKVSDYGRSLIVPGVELKVYIPFEGDPGAFRFRARSWNTCHPCGAVVGNEVVLTYAITGHDSEKIKADIQRDVSNLKQWLQWVAADVERHNATLPVIARERIEARRQRLLKDQGLVASLGFPLKRRENAPVTYSIPVVRKRIVPKMPGAGSTSFRPEPALDMADYEQILSVISDMSVVMERSPHAFKDMKEEDLRIHFLVQLNGQYEGRAMGETFNYEGKTDILVREEGKNIFIAECKFWRGPESIQKAVDQLLGYTSWRDTKTALIVFNKDGNLTAVMDKAKEVAKKHPNWKRDLAYISDTGFRCVLRNRDDADREIILTVMFFNVPGKGSKGGAS